MIRRPPRSTLFPTRRSPISVDSHKEWIKDINETQGCSVNFPIIADHDSKVAKLYDMIHPNADSRSEEHTSELQSRPHLVCRLLLEKKKEKQSNKTNVTT